MHIFALLLSLVLLGSCTMTNNSNTPTSISTPVTSVGPIWTEQKPFATVLKEASWKITGTPEFENCMRPSVNMCLNQVGNELARKNKSADFCNEMTDPAMQDACKFGVVMMDASESGDIKRCDSLSANYKESCRSSLIMQEANTSGDVTKCDALSTDTEKKNQCYMMIISRDPDATIDACTKIESEREKTMCEMLIKNRRDTNTSN